MVTKTTELPTFEELEVPEIKMTAVPLLAAALHMGKFCDQQSKVCLSLYLKFSGIYAL